MKHCPVCERRYEDEMRLCGVDGTPLEQMNESQPVRDLYIGRTINGRYQIISKLGEDGVGTVYLAEQVSMARKVVLKLLQRNYATHDDLVARFRREARLAASLNHPFIVTVYDFDQTDDETRFIAMAYVDPPSPEDVIRTGSRFSIA